MNAEAEAEFRRIPGFEKAKAKVRRLGGLTNRVFGVDADSERYVLRIPGEGTEAYIDRAVEAHNARAAARAGVSPAVIHADVVSGVMLTRHVEGHTMSPESFRTLPGAPSRAAAVFKALHGSGEKFEFRFELFGMIDSYLKLLDRPGVTLPDGYHDVLRRSPEVRDALARHPVALAPCHCDPLCENFIDTGERMWLVDWEYSGMNDPLWDLGDLSVEAGLSAEQDGELMHAYFGGPVPAAMMGRMVIYKAMCDLLWTLWGLIQHASNNPADDFLAYANGRFARCKKLIDSPELRIHLDAVRAG